MLNKKSVLSITFLPILLLGVSSCVSKPAAETSASNHIALQLNVSDAYHFIAFGDTRFHDPSDTEPANPAVRHALVAAIAKEKPAFVSIGGDLVYNGGILKIGRFGTRKPHSGSRRKFPSIPRSATTNCTVI